MVYDNLLWYSGGVVGYCVYHYWGCHVRSYLSRIRYLRSYISMDAIELNGILQSDMKLWDIAEKSTNDKGQLVVKTELPHGIGEYEIIFEGVTNAIQRRAAAEQWAANIRAAVDDVIGEESVSAKAEQAAARVSRDADQLHAVIGIDNRRGQTLPYRTTIQAHEESLNSFGEDPSDKLDGLRGLVSEYTRIIRSMEREIKALTAYVEVMNEAKEQTYSQGMEQDTSDDATP